MRQELSPIELSFWYQYRFDPLSDANNVVHRLVIDRSIDEAGLRKTLNQLVGKHPALRASFQEEDGVPFRTIDEAVHLDIVDGSSMANETILDHMRHPFVLEQDSLLRVILVHHEHKTTLFIACPHIVFDAMSWNILLNDFADALRGSEIGFAYTLQPVEYESRAQQYWESRLSKVEGRVSFEQSTAAQTNVGSLGTLDRPDVSIVLEELIKFGKTEGLSMNSLCISILAVTLYKATDSERMIIATPVTTRDEDSATHIGSYINVLPAVIDMDGNKSFITYAKSVSGQLWEGIDNRNFSLIKLLGNLPVKYHNDSQGIYNVMTEYVPYVSRDDIILEDEIVPNKSAKLDFTFSVLSEGTGHRINVEYDASKLEASYVAQLTETFLAVADSILKRPDQSIKDIPLIDDAAAHELLEIGSGPTRDIEPPFVWNRFKATAKRYPDRAAVKENDKVFSYDELFKLSCRYAGLLSENNVTVGSVVGVHIERSADYIASMLAIWSLGAVYVPLDTKQPSSRLKLMTEQAGVSVVLVRGKSNLESNVIECDITESSDSKLCDSDYEPDGEDMAYVIFTSGSTGTPKGVMIEHRGFLNHLEIMVESLKLGSGDVIAQTAPVSFDVSVWQLVCAVMVGASARVVDHDDLIDPDCMYGIIADDNVSVLEVVPSLLSGYLAAEATSDELRGVLGKVNVITTGEAISSSIVKQWVTRYPDQPLLNAYGPAEASDDTHFFDIVPASVDGIRSIPIGRSLLNIRTYIVNRDLQLCPKGVIGEICIGGIAVAKGYIGNEELTAKSFVPDPFTLEANARLYRTGDYGRWRDDNLLEYHGRRDHQVKVRGQRLELGEVENRLKEVSGVKDAAVIAQNVPSGTRLVGYVIPSAADVNADEVKTELRSMLPDYMVPWKLVLVPELPRSRNGKLDRKTLEMYSSDTEHAHHYEGEDSRLLSKIVQVYSDVLGVQIQRDSNYFDCGGDSLQSMKIVALLEKHGIRVGIRDILLYQTPEELGESIDRERIEHATAAESWPVLDGLTSIQHHYIEKVGKEHLNDGEIQAAIITLTHETPLSSSVLLTALKEVMASHAELRPTENSSPSLIVAPEQYDIEETIHNIRTRLTMDNPLIGCLLLSQDDPKILLVAHHFILDFYSWDIIRKDLSSVLKGQVIPKENVLKRWWGRALSDLSHDASRVAETQEFWKQSHSGKQSDIEATAGSTQSLSYTYTLPEVSVAKLARDGISLENLAYYAVAQAYMTATRQDVFVCNIESSLRSLDSTGVLSQGIGWMTYLFPVRIEQSASLADVCKITVTSAKRGYEYGLLRYNVSPELFKSASDSAWTINYLGKNMEGDDGVTVIKELPQMARSFVEIDVRYAGSQLIVEFCHNTTLTKTYFDLLHEEISNVIRKTVDQSESDRSKLAMTDERKDAILRRLKNAE